MKISPLLSPAQRVEVYDSIKDDMRTFIAGIGDDIIDMKSLGLAELTLVQITDSINAIYRLK